MTTLPGSGQLSLLQVRNHIGRTGEVTLPDDLYRGNFVPDIQQFTGSGRFSNDTGARFQVLRLFIHESFNSGSPEGFFSINFDTSGAIFANPVDGELAPDADVREALMQFETQITAEYPAFEFSEVTHHTAQASSIEINCTNAAVQSGAHTIYLHGNFINDDAGFIAVPIDAGSDAGDIADDIETQLRSDLRDTLFTVDREGNDITLSSTGRIVFWMSDESADETFTFSTSTWSSRPRIRELEPILDAATKRDGSPVFDLGSDAGRSILINTLQNGNPSNSATYTPDPSSVDYWLDLTTEVEGDDASATEHITRIAIEDDFNGGAELGEYPDYVAACIEVAGFNSVTHTVGNNFSFPTGGSIRSQSVSNAWAITDRSGGSQSTSTDASIQLTNNTGSVVDFTNGRIDVSITVTGLPAGGETTPSLNVQSTGSLFSVQTDDDPIDQLGERIFSDIEAFNNVGQIMIQPGASLRIYFDEDTTTEQGFTYTVNYVRLSTTQLEYKPAGDYPDIPGSVAAVQFTQGTFPTGEAQSFVAGGQLDGLQNGWIFHPISTTPHTILFEREFGDVDLSNGVIDVSITVTSFPAGFNTATDHINIGLEVVNTEVGLELWDATLAINELREYVFSTNAPLSNSAVMVTEGNSLSVALFVDDAVDRGFTYNINYVRISASSVNYTPTGGTASYTLDLDTTNLTFDGTTEDNFVGGATAT